MENMIESLDALREHLACSICRELCSDSSHFLQCRHNFCSKHAVEISLSCLMCGDVANNQFEKSVCTNEMVHAYKELQAIFAPFKPVADEIVSSQTNTIANSLNTISPKRPIQIVRSRINTRSRSPPKNDPKLTPTRKSLRGIKFSPLKNEKENNEKISNESYSKENGIHDNFLPPRRLRSGDRNSKKIKESSIHVDKSVVDESPKQETVLNNSTSNARPNRIKNKNGYTAKENIKQSVGSVDVVTETEIELNTLEQRTDATEEMKVPLLVLERNKFIDQITTKKEIPNTLIKCLSKQIEKRNRKGETPLHSACVICNIKIIKELLSGGANPNTKDFAGWTPLHEAVSSNRLDIVELLLQHNALPDVPGLDNETPLHEAVRNGYTQVAELLVQYGASTNVRNSKGLTPMELANEQLKSSFIIIQASVSMSQTEKQQFSLHLMEAESETIRLYSSSTYKTTLKAMQNLSKTNMAIKIEKLLFKSTHVIAECGVNYICVLSRDILYAAISGKWIISKEWLHDSDIKNLAKYSINTLEGATNGVELSRLNRYKQLPGLFNGCHFYFIGLDPAYEINASLKVDKSFLVSLVEAGGGIVLKREPRPESIPDKEKVFPYHAGKNSALSECAHYIIYKTQPSLAYNMKHIKALPVKWLIDCIRHFHLVDP